MFLPLLVRGKSSFTVLMLPLSFLRNSFFVARSFFDLPLHVLRFSFSFLRSSLQSSSFFLSYSFSIFFRFCLFGYQIAIQSNQILKSSTVGSACSDYKATSPPRTNVFSSCDFFYRSTPLIVSLILIRHGSFGLVQW